MQCAGVNHLTVYAPTTAKMSLTQPAPHRQQTAASTAANGAPFLGNGQCDRVVKVMDSKSIGLCPQGFKSPRCRSDSNDLQEKWGRRRKKEKLRFLFFLLLLRRRKCFENVVGSILGTILRPLLLLLIHCCSVLCSPSFSQFSAWVGIESEGSQAWQEAM